VHLLGKAPLSRLRAAKPWRRAFRFARAWPAAVLGPVLARAFSDWQSAGAALSCHALLFFGLVVKLTEFGVLHLRNHLAQAIAEIDATLVGLMISSITALLHQCDHAFEQFKGVNVACQGAAAGEPRPAILRCSL
jgi:hypothetical protein